VHTFNDNSFRQHFPILAHSDNAPVYLDSAATTQMPQPVMDAINQYYREGHGNVHRATHVFSRHATTAYEAARKRVARWIHAPHPHSIIWTSGTTAGINLIAAGLDSKIKPHQTILVSAMEHHANLIPWQQLAKRTGAKLAIIAVTPSGDLDLADFERQLDHDTALVALAHVSNSLGTVNPVAQVCRMAKDVGAMSIIDGAQAIAHCAVDVQRIGCDAYVLSGHKMYGPTGIGVIYGKLELLESLHPTTFGGEMVSHVSYSDAQFAQLPHRLEAGTPNISGAIGLAAAIDFIEQWPIAQRQAHEQQLLSYARKTLSQLPRVHLLANPAMSAGIVAFEVEGIHPHDIATLLDQQGIAIRCGHHCAMPITAQFAPQGSLRASFGLYNRPADIDALCQGLTNLLELFNE
jgi:cysteine sulfinate desulfinase/cysteine desulfurase/selenocysteine lyase